VENLIDAQPVLDVGETPGDSIKGYLSLIWDYQYCSFKRNRLKNDRRRGNYYIPNRFTDGMEPNTRVFRNYFSRKQA